jgi:hypothetical protein
MALTPGEGGGGVTMGGTASSICAISPSDTASTIGNLLERIEALELALSQVLGANLHADTLGDISSQVGWVYGVEYMGIPGWIQTEYGTLIPPAGFTLSGSGIQMWNACTGEFEDYQAVVMDENGVLQWGASAAGNLCGAKVEEWNDAAANAVNQDYAHISWALGQGGTIYNGSRGVIISSSSISGIDIEIQLTVVTAGVYWVMGGHEFQKKTGQTATSDSVGLYVNGVLKYFKGATAEGASANATRADVTAGGVLVLAAGDVVRYDNNPTALTQNSVNSVNYSLIRISN